MLHEFMYGEEMPEPVEEVVMLPEKSRQLMNLSRKKDLEINALQKRLENLEAIITSQKWEDLERDEELVMATRKVAELSKELK